MPLIKLITSYLDFPAGKEISQDSEKCEQLVNLGRAEYVKKEEKKGTYENKMMTTDGFAECYKCEKCKKEFKKAQGLKIHQARFCK